MKTGERHLIAVVSGVLAFVMSGCGGSAALISVERTITVDGESSDWAGIANYNENRKLNVSVSNDDQFAYIMLATNDQSTQMTLMRAGLTVWFDREGGKEKTLGINFPRGGMRFGPPPMAGDGNLDPPDEMKHTLESQMTELEIRGPKENDRYRLSIASAAGIQVKIARNRNESLVYELRIPLKRSSEFPYAIDAAAGSKIGIGFETGEIERPQGNPPADFEGGRGGGMPGGGMPQGGPPERGGPPRGGWRGGGRRPEMRESMSPIDFWTTVQLASKTQTQGATQ